MAQVINTNSLSLLTQNNLNKSQSALGTAIERLSSGLRINSAKDDAAGQAIANHPFRMFCTFLSLFYVHGEAICFIVPLAIHGMVPGVIKGDRQYL
ncbi:hypothetical protein MJL33_05340, partial [Salmonella enterica subsp. enterica serovar Kentucky]|nr:hypothetical protein [Salmonella enterica subsp. enterica serovar Kentucky]